VSFRLSEYSRPARGALAYFFCIAPLASSMQCREPELDLHVAQCSSRIETRNGWAVGEAARPTRASMDKFSGRGRKKRRPNLWQVSGLSSLAGGCTHFDWPI
jgi:hypothetical protein